MSGCSLTGGKLTVTFNSSLLAGDKVILQKYGKGTPSKYGVVGGSYFDAQTAAESFRENPSRRRALPDLDRE